MRGFEVADTELHSNQMLFINTHPSELEDQALIESLREIRKAFPDRSIAVELPESILSAPDSLGDLRAMLTDLCQIRFCIGARH